MRNTTDHVQETKPRTYADDWRLFAQGLRRKAAHDIVGGFVTASDEFFRTGVSLTKFVILAPGSSARAVLRQVAGAFRAQEAVHIKDLGVDDTPVATRRVPAQRRRVGDAIASAGRIARFPHCWQGTARLMASLSRNQSKWGMDIAGLPGHAAGRFRSAYLRAISGGSAARRAPEVILALVAPQAFLDLALRPTRQVILSWAKRVAMDHALVELVAQAWTREVDQLSPPGKPRWPIALIVTQLRRLGWEPTEPGLWHQGLEPRSVYGFEGLRSHLDRALSFPRWEALAERRRDFAGAEDGIDEEASFREPLKAWNTRWNTVFGNTLAFSREAPGPGTATPGPDLTWTPVALCVGTPGRPQCTGGGYAPGGTCLGAPRAGSWPSSGPQLWQPRCLWECGLLPTPATDGCPPAPTSEAGCGKPRQRRFPGKYLVFTDASATRPKDPYLRRAACAFWAGDPKSDSAAWSLPGPVQTVYRAELFAVLVALAAFREEVGIVSDCKGVVDEAERIRAGGRVSQPHLQARRPMGQV